MKELSKSDLALLPHFKSHLSEKTDERSVRLLALINKRLANESLADDDLKILKLGVQLYRAERSKLAKAKRLGAIESNEKKQAAKARNHRLILLGVAAEKFFDGKKQQNFLALWGCLTGHLSKKDCDTLGVEKYISNNTGLARAVIYDGDLIFALDEKIDDANNKYMSYYQAKKADDGKYYYVGDVIRI